MARLQTLDDLLVEELRTLYSADRQILKALSKMSALASREVADALDECLLRVYGHLDRLEAALGRLDRRPKARKGKAMTGLLGEAKDLRKKTTDPEVRDAAFLALARQIVHYLRAGHQTAQAQARQRHHGEVVSLLEANLQEMEELDRLLERGIWFEQEAEQAAPGVETITSG